MAEARHGQGTDRLANHLGAGEFAGMGRAAQPGLGGDGEGAGELRRRPARFVAGQAEAAHVGNGMTGRQYRERLGRAGAAMTLAVDDDAGFDSGFAPRGGDAGGDALHLVGIGQADIGAAARRHLQLGIDGALGRDAREIVERHVAIVLGRAHRAGGDVEIAHEGDEIAARIGAVGAEQIGRQRHAMPRREPAHRRGRQRAEEVDVDIGLGQGVAEHDGSYHRPPRRVIATLACDLLRCLDAGRDR